MLMIYISSSKKNKIFKEWLKKWLFKKEEIEANLYLDAKRKLKPKEEEEDEKES